MNEHIDEQARTFEAELFGNDNSAQISTITTTEYSQTFTEKILAEDDRIFQSCLFKEPEDYTPLEIAEKHARDLATEQVIKDLNLDMKDEMVAFEVSCGFYEDDIQAAIAKNAQLLAAAATGSITQDYPEKHKAASIYQQQAAINKFGTRELSDTSINSLVGCFNNCLYCYAAQNAIDKQFVRSREYWASEKPRKTMPEFSKKYPGRVMYPTSHDIIPKHLQIHINAVRSLLDAGNELLICSKARLECLKEIAKICADHKEQVIFMITVTSLDEAQSIFWEPNAPLPAERIVTLEYLHAEGFRTSVLVEPLLQGAGTAMDIYNRVIEFVTEDIWFGTMNYVESRVDMTNPDNVKAAELLKRYHSHENMLFLYNNMVDMPKVRFKRSIAVLSEKSN